MVASAQEINDIGIAAGLCAVAITTADPFPEVRAEIERRRDAGLHASMQFTFRNPARSTDPERTLPGATALIVGAYDYQRLAPAAPTDRLVGRVAAYSWEDHYARLRDALEQIAQRLRKDGARAMVLADQNHLVDRAAADRAGIGWWGKSSNILVPGVGSLVVLGSVLTDAPLTIDKPAGVPDQCGSCTQCLDGCPTNAFVAPGVIDARRCLAWLVQTEGMFPIEYRVALGDRMYGCDECQDVCPPNKIRRRRPSEAGADQAWVEIIDLLDSTDDDLLDRLGRWYIPNRDPAYLRRNALVVLANIGDGHDADTRRVVGVYLAHRQPMLRAHAVWAARQLGIDLPDSIRQDADAGVQTELARP